jgi:hypothetical protein
MTGDVPYYGGRFTPAQAYAASHPRGRPAQAPPATQPTPAEEGPAEDPVAALEHLRAAGVITPDEYSELLARVTA